MKDLKSLLEIANSVQEYVAHQGKTLSISQGKMLRDEEMPSDVRELLKSA